MQFLRVAYTAHRTLALESGTATAPPPPGHVAIDVAYTGICGTDLHIFHGSMDARVGPPQVIGHEMSGRVAQAAPDVTGWEAGDNVTVNEMPATRRLRVLGDGDTVSSKPVDLVVVRGRDNQVTVRSARIARLASPGSTLRSPGLLETVRVPGNRGRVRNFEDEGVLVADGLLAQMGAVGATGDIGAARVRRNPQPISVESAALNVA